eukprot:Clim_evm3s15 gene=Clim_evmTU3s15
MAVTPMAQVWTNVQDKVREAIASVSMQNVIEPDRTNGPTNSQATLRLFGQPESEVRVTLWRDNHAWCPYCERVWLQLEEMQIPYRIRKVNMRCYGSKPDEFMKKQPSGMLPLLELDGEIIRESDTIMVKLEETFPEKSLLPKQGTEARDTVEGLLKLERIMFNAWLDWLCRPGDDQERSVRFREVMGEVDRALNLFSQGPYFLGQQLTMVDCVYAPMLERIAASLMYYKGFRVRGGEWEHINAWFCAMETRPTYQGIMSDYHTHVHDLPPQLGQCIANGTEAQKAAAASIDGKADGAWQLPLKPLTHGDLSKVDEVEPAPYGKPEETVRDCLQAALRTALHGSQASAHALDTVLPTITSQDQVGQNEVCKAIEMSFMSAVGGLLATASASAQQQELPSSVQLEGDLQNYVTNADTNKQNVRAVAFAIAFTRDRVNTPRDMPFSAARQLRAHLNATIAAIIAAAGDTGDERQIEVPIPIQHRKDQNPALFAQPGAAA